MAIFTSFSLKPLYSCHSSVPWHISHCNFYLWFREKHRLFRGKSQHFTGNNASPLFCILSSASLPPYCLHAPFFDLQQDMLVMPLLLKTLGHHALTGAFFLVLPLPVLFSIWAQVIPSESLGFILPLATFSGSDGSLCYYQFMSMW